MKSSFISLPLCKACQTFRLAGFFCRRCADFNGYPGKTLVDEGSNEVAWFVVQHPRKIEKYLPLIKQPGEVG